MRSIVDWLDNAKRITGSDYATAKQIGVTRQSISKMRAGGHIPSNKICERLAEIIGVNPLEIIASCEVAKDPSEAERWKRWLGAAAILACVLFSDFTLNSKAYAEPLNVTSYTLCAVKFMVIAELRPTARA